MPVQRPMGRSIGVYMLWGLRLVGFRPCLGLRGLEGSGFGLSSNRSGLRGAFLTEFQSTEDKQLSYTDSQYEH